MGKESAKCRVCLTGNAGKLFDWHAPMDLQQELTYAQCFQQCTQLAVKDEFIMFPQVLCYNCAKELRLSYGFIVKAREADLTLRRKHVATTNRDKSGEAFEWVGVVEKQTATQDQTAENELKPEVESTLASEHDENEVALSHCETPQQEVEQQSEATEHVEEKVSLKQCETPQAEEMEIVDVVRTSLLTHGDIRQESKNDQTITEQYLVTKKRRGRPPKNASSENNKNSINDQEVVVQKKRRGRPAKSTITPKKSADTIEDEASKQSKKQVMCEYCSDIFPKKQLLKRHLLHKHKPQKQLCHACPRTFRDARSLYAHTLTHEENRERKYNCEQCTRKFYTERAYNNHTKTHDSNRRMYQCDRDQCEKSFFHKGSLKLHLLRHDGKTVDCNICQKRYLRRIDLEIHLRSHSGNKPYQCPYCEKAFTQAGVLNKHVRAHEGIRYKCDICSKEYTHQSTMIQHRKQHTGNPLKCAICGKGFVKKSKMRRHIAGVHKVIGTEQVDALIEKVKTLKTYRGRMLEDY